jgi:hypothetical protein
MELDEKNMCLLHSRVCHQSEGQSRQTMQRGLDALQQSFLNLSKDYRSIYRRYDNEKAKLQEDLRVSDELISTQKELVDLYQGQNQQQQQPASHLVQGGPLLSQYLHPTTQYSTTQHPTTQSSTTVYPTQYSYASQYSTAQQPNTQYSTTQQPNTQYSTTVYPTQYSYSTTQPPRSQDFIMDPAGLRLLNDLDDLGSSVEPSCSTDTDTVPVAEVENQTPTLSVQSMLHPTSAERGPNHDKSYGNKRGPEDEGTKPSKKRKSK